MATNLKHISFTLLLITFLNICCSKRDEFLNAKPQESLSTISSLDDAQNLLDNENLFNLASEPLLGELSSDDYYISDATWLEAPQNEQNAYLWAKQIYPVGKDVADWTACYQQVYVCNVVLDALKSIQITSSEKTRLNNIEGTALLLRGYAFFNLMQIFSLPYNASTSKLQLGVPLRLDPDLNERSSRATTEQCYNQIIKDVLDASKLLPVNVKRITLPNKAAAYGLLSRVYLSMSDYRNCKLFSDSCLDLHSAITDFNIIQPASFQLTSPSVPYLEEDIFHKTAKGYNIVSLTRAIVDSTLFSLYDSTDLRRTLFFTVYQNQIRFKGSFEFHLGGFFTGISTSEILLNRAECLAKSGMIVEAMRDLNKVLQNRYKIGSFVARTAGTDIEARRLILTERRKELCFRGLRWIDLRRLNQEPDNAKLLTRRINGVLYQLPPNDLKYALPIPDNEILASGIEQNAR